MQVTGFADETCWQNSSPSCVCHDVRDCGCAVANGVVVALGTMLVEINLSDSKGRMPEDSGTA